MVRSWGRPLFLFVDTLSVIGAGLTAFVIRFALDGQATPLTHLRHYLSLLPLLVVVKLLCNWLFGVYRQDWRHASLPELFTVFWATVVGSLLSAFIIYGQPPSGFPRSILLIAWFLEVGLIGLSRVAVRQQIRAWGRAQSAGGLHKALVFGAGAAGAMLLREFAKHPELPFDIVGFVDDDQAKVGYRVAGKQVLGTRAELAGLVQQHGVSHLIIAAPSSPPEVMRAVVQQARNLGLQLKTVPGLYELVDGRVKVSQVRDIELGDILGRPEVQVDLAEIAGYLSGEVVLVTGAGGSIGGELSRQVARFDPRQLLLLGHGENSIYEIEQELRGRYPDLDLVPLIADIKDEEKISRLFERFRPGVVFHAAAHKHVPLMEANPDEAVKNNVFGTLNLARAADRFGAKRFVMISTDKAVNPTSVMGATKRAAELVTHHLGARSQTKFVVVRFGNVLGSRGSVVPLFQKQIAAGGPVTITDRRMTRFFMTIPEAAQLVIQAAAMGQGGETFVLDMGEPVRIIDLATELIRLSGYEPGVDIAITCTGIRPGEKLYEELLTNEEGTQATRHQRIFIARSEPVAPSVMERFLSRLRDDVNNHQVRNHGVLAQVTEIAGKVALQHASGAGD